MSTKENFTTPCGRLVMGSLYEPQTTDADNKPLTIKTGVDAGKPRVAFFFALAIPKGPEPHWAHTDWGQKIWSVGHLSFPGGEAQAPSFAWKIIDGDDSSENTPKGKKRRTKICDREGHKGHWILNFQSSFAPQTHRYIRDLNKVEPILETGAINLGDFVQVTGTVVGNNSTSSPGIHLNHNLVCLIGYGTPITFGVDPNSVGFGAALPAGASATPLAQAYPTQAKPSYIPPPAAAPLATAVTAARPVPVASPTTIAVTPYPAILNTPAPGATPPPVAVPAPAIPAKIILPHPQHNPTGTITYEQFIDAGWNDALLMQHGLMNR